MKEGHGQTKDPLPREFGRRLELSLEMCYFLWRVVVFFLIGATMIGVQQVRMCYFEAPLRQNEHKLWGQVDQLLMVAGRIQAALENAVEFYLFEQFLLVLSGLNLVDKFDSGVFVDPVYFVEVGADAVVLLGPHLYHLQHVLALLGAPIR